MYFPFRRGHFFGFQVVGWVRDPFTIVIVRKLGRFHRNLRDEINVLYRGEIILLPSSMDIPVPSL